jgi:hypothetical protein
MVEYSYISLTGALVLLIVASTFWYVHLAYDYLDYMEGEFFFFFFFSLYLI